MPSQTKFHLLAENATLRARLAELKDLLANRFADRREELSESDNLWRRRAEDRLFLASRRLEGIMKALPVGVCFSEDPLCQRITGNPAFFAQFESSFEDNLSASAPEKSAWGRNVRYFREGKEVGAAGLPMQRSIAEGKSIGPTTFEIELPSGRRWFAEVSATPIRNRQEKIVGSVAVTVDVTSHKQLDDALKASEVRYRRLFETAKDGILILDADTGRITDTNLFLEDLLGYSHAELLGKMLWEIGPLRDIAAGRGAFRRLQRSKYIHHDNLPLETKGHRHRHVEFISNVYEVDGKKVMQCNIRDVTVRHQAEAALAKASKELERHVDERTAELLSANKAMKGLLEDGKRAEEQIRQSRERLRNLSGRLQSLLEDERARISREIHDELGQALTAVKLDLSMTRRSLASDGRAEQSAKVHEIEGAVHHIIGTVRRIATELRPGILDELGVGAAIEWMVQDFQKRTGIGCTVVLPAANTISDTRRATAVFRVVQEALTNVMRHAAASQVKVSLKTKNDTLILEVRDNGIGIKKGRIFDAGSLGLIGIRERVLALGGEGVISGRPGGGTLVRVTIPNGSGADSNA